MKTLTIVTHNKGKFIEARQIAKKYGVKLVMPEDLQIAKFEIQADSVAEVAEYSAKEAYKYIKRPLIIDDSGLFIDALQGFPGVYSAPINAMIGMKGILKLMEGVKDRDAYFECAVAFYDGKRLMSFLGHIHGFITNREQGTGGFGYDPIFTPKGYSGKSFGEFRRSDKNRISHRRRALEAFFEWYCK
jgi:XTP/dITP diphosphohydrolase